MVLRCSLVIVYGVVVIVVVVVVVVVNNPHQQTYQPTHPPDKHETYYSKQVSVHAVLAIAINVSDRSRYNEGNIAPYVWANRSPIAVMH